MNTFAGTALLTLALAATGAVSEASAQAPLAQWLSAMPVNGGVQRLDQNRDGWVDLILYDTNGDGRAEALRSDSNRDGYLELVGLDTDRNGVYSEYFVDDNRDGFLNVVMVDNNQDGHMDVVGYDPNRTGHFSGWQYLPAASAPAASPSGMLVIGDHSNVSVLPHSAANAALGRLPGYSTGAGATGNRGTRYDPVAPGDQCTYTDHSRTTRVRGDGSRC